MSKNHDLVLGDIDDFVGFVSSETAGGKLPKNIRSTFVYGGAHCNHICGFLALHGRNGAVYIARDKHDLVYSINLVKTTRALGRSRGAAEELMRSGFTIDEFVARLWSKPSVGGLYRRAKTRVRCRKYAKAAFAQSAQSGLIAGGGIGQPMGGTDWDRVDESGENLGGVFF